MHSCARQRVPLTAIAAAYAARAARFSASVALALGGEDGSMTRGRRDGIAERESAT